MQLQPLVLSIRHLHPGVDAETRFQPDSDRPCSFCGIRSGEWQVAVEPPNGSGRGAVACPLCELSLDLGRPTIDQEAVLAWLPELSQQVVNTIMRSVHMQLLAVQEGVASDDRILVDTPRSRVLYQTRALLGTRSREVGLRLGTSLPSELAVALRYLPPESYAVRGVRLGGVRLLPLGRYFRAGEDVYSEVVSTWLRREPPSPEGVPPLQTGRASPSSHSLPALPGVQ